jgi:hypothetical protein
MVAFAARMVGVDAPDPGLSAVSRTPQAAANTIKPAIMIEISMDC